MNFLWAAPNEKGVKVLMQSLYVVGQRQILRELNRGGLSKILIASDADEKYVASLLIAANDAGVCAEKDCSMAELGVKYGIGVAAGAVGILKK